MTEPYDVTDELTKLATWVDDQLAEEGTSRQYIAEQAAARIKDIALAMLGVQELAARHPDLLGCELTIGQALADAIRWRQAQAAAGPARSRGGHAEQARPVPDGSRQAGPHPGAGRHSRTGRARVPRRGRPVSADLDRGVIAAGRDAAEALARTVALEDRCAALEARVRALFVAIAEVNRVMGVTPGDPELAGGPYEATAAVQARRREIHAVPGGAR